jgi:hypothetical protein
MDTSGSSLLPSKGSAALILCLRGEGVIFMTGSHEASTGDEQADNQKQETDWFSEAEEF